MARRTGSGITRQAMAARPVMVAWPFRPVRKVFPAVFASLVTMLAASCPEPMDAEFVQAVEASIAEAQAAVRTLTIDGDGNGVVSPDGDVSVRDGIPFALGATPFSSHVFGTWTKTDGTGTVVFSDAGSADSTVTVSGGNAVVSASFTARPTVYYATPTGAGIFTNTKIYIYFSGPMDEAAVEADGAIRVLRGGTVEVPGTVELIDTNVVRFTPDVNLAPQSVFVIMVDKSVLDASLVSMEADYSSSFRTTGTADTIAPTFTAFSIDGVENPLYVLVRNVLLDGFAANDEGEIVEALVRYGAGEFISFPYTPEIGYALDGPEGETSIAIKLVDSVGNTTDPALAKTFRLDLGPPVLSSFTIQPGDGHGGDGSGLYTNDAAVTLSSGLTDAAGSPLQMRFGHDGASWSPDWTTYSASYSHTLPAGDGLKTVYYQFRDQANPAVHVVSGTSTITLDTTAPTVSLTSPPYADPPAHVAGVLTMAADASDATSGMDKVNFELSTAPFPADGQAPYQLEYELYEMDEDTVLSVVAIARDRAGNTTTTAGRSVVVDNWDMETVSPSVVVSAGATCSVAVDASGAVYLAYDSSSSLYIVKRIWNGSAWVWSSPYLLAAGGEQPNLQFFGTTLYIVYRNASTIYFRSSTNPAANSWSVQRTVGTSAAIDNHTTYPWNACLEKNAEGRLYTAYLGSYGNSIYLYASNDGGTNWSAISSGMITEGSVLLHDTAIDDENLYILYSKAGSLYLAGRSAASGVPISGSPSMVTYQIDSDSSPKLMLLSDAPGARTNAIEVLYTSNGRTMVRRCGFYAGSWVDAGEPFGQTVGGFPATASGFRSDTSAPCMYLASISSNEMRMTVSHSYDGMEWHAYGTGTAAMYPCYPSACFQGDNLYVAWWDDSTDKLKFIIFGVNY